MRRIRGTLVQDGSSGGELNVIRRLQQGHRFLRRSDTMGGLAQKGAGRSIAKVDHAFHSGLADHWIRVEQIGLNQRQGLGVVGD